MPNAMRLKIRHVTSYSYDEPAGYALQRLRLIPRTGHGQSVIEWGSTVTGGTKQLTFDDQFVNHTELVRADDTATRIEIVSEGIVDVSDRNGVIGQHHGFAPLWLFTDPTSLTTPGPTVRQLVRRLKTEAKGTDMIGTLHALSAMILEQVAYKPGETDSGTTAEKALTAGHGVCQDHAHIMISAARLLGQPARYISGYLFMDEAENQDATHAWCEVWTDTLGWVGFDVSNAICPDERYVRVATGRDYRDAAPISGIRQGSGDEALHVALQVQQ